MEIVLCAKEVRDPDAVDNYALHGKLEIGADGKTLTQASIPRVMHDYDEQAIEAAETTVDLTALEDAFAAAAKGYGERKGISYAAWRKVGVVCVKSGARSGTVGSASGLPAGPPKPPSPRAKTTASMVQSSAPSATFTSVVSNTSRAPRSGPLS